MANVVISVEQQRGCGYRKAAKDGVGVYLVGPAEGRPCGRIPFPLTACPTCGGGIHASRGWNWIEPQKLFGEKPWVMGMPCGEGRRECERCPLGLGIPEGRHGLIWVGESFYGTPEEFAREAHRMGVSRKIKAVPKGFELGVTWVFLAHRLTPLGKFDPESGETLRGPAIFMSFKPSGIDLVIEDEHNVPEKAEKMAEKYGARIVKVVHEVPPDVVPAQHSLPMVP